MDRTCEQAVRSYLYFSVKFAFFKQILNALAMRKSFVTYVSYNGRRNLGAGGVGAEPNRS